MFRSKVKLHWVVVDVLVLVNLISAALCPARSFSQTSGAFTLRFSVFIHSLSTKGCVK